MFEREPRGPQFELSLPEPETTQPEKPKNPARKNSRKRRKGAVRLEQQPEKRPPYNSRFHTQEALQKIIIDGITVKSSKNPRSILVEKPAEGKGDGYYKMALRLNENGQLIPFIDDAPDNRPVPTEVQDSMINAAKKYLSDYLPDSSTHEDNPLDSTG